MLNSSNSSKSHNSKSDEQPQSNNQSIEERVMIMMKKKLAKRKRLPKKEFVEQYVPRHKLFCGQDPTKEEINSAYISCKNSGKRKRIKPKSEPEMIKEEFVAMISRNSVLLFGEPPTEEDLNREYDLYKLDLQCKKLRSQKRKAAFRECMGQEIADRYAPDKVAESQGGVMAGSLDMQAEDSRTSYLIKEGEQGEVVTAEGMGTMPCQNTVTDVTTGGTSTMTTAEQMFSERVMGIMDYARGHLSSYPSIREQIEYWNEIVEAWEEFTEKSFFQGDLEDEEWEKELEEGKS